MKAGASVSYSLTITPVAGFTGAVTLTCTGLPSYAKCSALPASVASSLAIATVTVATSPSALALLRGEQSRLLRRRCVHVPALSSQACASRIGGIRMAHCVAADGRSTRLRRVNEGADPGTRSEPDIEVHDPGNGDAAWYSVVHSIAATLITER